LTKVRVWFDKVEIEYDENYQDVILKIDDEEFKDMTDDEIMEVAKQKFTEEYKYPVDWDSEYIRISDVDSNETYIHVKDDKTEITQRECFGTDEQTMGIFDKYKEEK